jgi:hypothetical protein
MRHVLGGLAILGLLAAALPAAAQNTGTGGRSPSAQDDATTPATSTHHKKHHKAHHSAKSTSRGGDHTADELNRQELARLSEGAPTSGSTMPAR